MIIMRKDRLSLILPMLACIGAMAHALAGSKAERPPRQCLSVRADQPWQSSGVTVNPNEFVCLAADGLWSHGGQGIQAITPFYDAEGFAKDDPVNVPEVVSRVGALIARMGGNAPFVLGRQLCFIPVAAGELSLSMNDAPGTFGNNIGVMRVQVARWPASAIPQNINMKPQECRPTHSGNID